MVVERDMQFCKQAITRINENIEFCKKKYDEDDLVQVYELLRMKYIKELASFLSMGETPTFVEYGMLEKVLKSTPGITKVELDAFGVTAYTTYQFTPTDLAKMYNYTGREFVIEDVNKIKFKVAI